ncbi:MAG: DMT family transporter [Phycisphaerales bacterium]|nr:DMT family transporter [Phycisphaerales bacterium]
MPAPGQPESRKPDRLGPPSAVLLIVTWSMPGVFIRLVGGLPDAEILAWRVSIAFAVLAPAVLLVRRWRTALFNALRHPASLGISAFMFGYFALAVMTYRHLPVAIGALIISTSPVWVLILRSYFEHRPSRRELCGVASALVGVAMCILPRLANGSDWPGNAFIGAALATGAALCSAGFVYSRSRTRDSARAVPAPVAATVTCAFGLPVLLWLVVLGDGLAATAFDARGWMLLIGLGAFSTALPTLAYSIVSSRLSSLVTAMLNLLVPLASGIAAAIILKEIPSAWTIPGGVLVLTGIWLVSTGGSRPIRPRL